MSGREWSLLLLLALVWTGAFTFAEVLLEEVGPVTVGALRLVIGGIALHIYLLVTGRSLPRSWKLWSAFFVMGLCNNALPFSLIPLGQVYLASGVAAIVNAMTPALTVIVAHCWYLGGSAHGERASLAKSIGAFVGFLGVGILMAPSLQGSATAPAFAYVMILLASLGYAFTAVYGRRFQGLDPMVAATGMVTCSALTLLPIALVFEPMPGSVSDDFIFAALFMGLLSTALAYRLYFVLLRDAGSLNTMLVTIILPPMVIVVGWLFLDEHLSAYHLLGMVIIFVGLAIIDGRVLTRGHPSCGGTRD